MKYRARCRKRLCQARRNLSKHPDEYKHPPTCHVKGCAGLMRIDRVRQAKKEKHPPMCTDPDCLFEVRHFEATGKLVPCHRVSSHLCSHYPKWVATRNAAPRSKHSPIPAEQWVPF